MSPLIRDNLSGPEDIPPDASVPRDLRTRFGLILGVALAPLLVLSIWQSLDDFAEERRDKEAVVSAALGVTQGAVRKAVQNVSDALELVTVEADARDCDEELAAVKDATPEIASIGLFEARGAYVCGPYDNALPRPLPVREGRSTAKRLVEVRAGASPRRRLQIARAMDDGSARQVAATLDWTPLWSVYRNLQMDEGMSLSLVGMDGQPLFANRADFPAVSPAALPESDAELSQARLTRTPDGRREVVVAPTVVKDVFVAVRRPRESFLSWQFVNLLTGALIPVLAWLFAFGAIWWAADRLILSHVRRLRATALLFAAGDTTQRVGEMQDAPQQIRQLGSTFDLMATNIAEREAVLQAGLEEKEVLLREIHHRVKNNLQIIISLLNMQAREISNTEGLQAIEDARNRVGAIALVHRSLYESDDLADVDMQPFLDQLVSDIYRSLGGRARGVSLHTNLASAEFEAQLAIPVALFVVEALSNALKHGVPDGGRVDVSFTEGGVDGAPGQRSLVIRDSGPGPAEGVESSTGWRLMRGFARQLGGDFKTEQTRAGFEVRLTF